MKLFFHRQSIEMTTTQREHVEMRVHLSLGRFMPSVFRVAVYVADTNGHRRGVDKRCRIVAKIQGSKDIVIEDHDSNFYVLVDRVTERLGRTVARRLERRRFGGLRIAFDGRRANRTNCEVSKFESICTQN